MAYRDLEKRRAAARRWYQQHKDDPREKASRAERRKRTRARCRAFLSERVDELKLSRGCESCGIRHPAVLQFHHSRGVKEFEISVAVARCFEWSRIEKEIAKCDVLCANCHMKTHPRRAPKAVPKRVRGRFLFDE